MNFLTTINRPYLTNSSGVILYQTIDAILLPGIPYPIAIQQLDNFELNAEDIKEATELWVSFEGEDYELPLPERDSMEWDWLIELIDPA